MKDSTVRAIIRASTISAEMGDIFTLFSLRRAIKRYIANTQGVNKLDALECLRIVNGHLLDLGY